MANWKIALGNLISRAPAFGVASGSTEDPVYPLADLGNGHPDDPSRWLFETDGGYAATFDLNLLAMESDRVDAPSGWADLTNRLNGTPGLPADPPVWGTFGTRPNTIKVFRPSYQDIDVMPGESVLFEAGLRVPIADGTSATAVKIVVIDLGNGKQWDGVLDAWNNSADPVAEASADAWTDVSETIVYTGAVRTTLRVMIVPVAGTYDSTSYVWVSDPGLTASQDFVALVGHNIPDNATVTWSDGTNTRVIVPARPSVYATGTASIERNWTLTITVPTNTAAFTSAPYIGELWAGRLIDLTACPGYPFDIKEEDLGQVRLEGGLGRESVFTEMEYPNRSFKLRFKTTNDAQYEDARDTLLRASRYGADPIILAPVDALEGAGTIWHGRIGQDVTFSRTTLTKRTFDVDLRESPFPRFGR